jgi:hypothetical protein
MLLRRLARRWAVGRELGDRYVAVAPARGKPPCEDAIHTVSRNLIECGLLVIAILLLLLGSCDQVEGFELAGREIQLLSIPQ